VEDRHRTNKDVLHLLPHSDRLQRQRGEDIPEDYIGSLRPEVSLSELERSQSEEGEQSSGLFPQKKECHLER